MTSLWCLDATLLNSDERVGILINTATADVRHVMQRARELHPDKHLFRLSTSCPVWAWQYWQVGFRFERFRGAGRLSLKPFQDQFPVLDTAIGLKLIEFEQTYDFYGLTSWYWEYAVSPMDVKDVLDSGWLLGRKYSHSWGHPTRIAWLVGNPDNSTPIQIVDYYVGKSHWMIRDGGHRYAAALYRGDLEIPAITTGDTALQLCNAGLARIV